MRHLHPANDEFSSQASSLEITVEKISEADRDIVSENDLVKWEMTNGTSFQP
jgi:hypothetical protein